MKRQITEKELKLAANQINLKFGIIELLIAKVRENQSKVIEMGTKEKPHGKINQSL